MSHSKTNVLVQTIEYGMLSKTFDSMNTRYIISAVVSNMLRCSDIWGKVGFRFGALLFSRRMQYKHNLVRNQKSK